MTQRVDAVIVGGGPAGALSALLLARMGWRVMLVERGGANRHKTCGHCLNPRALPLLQQAGMLETVRNTAVGSTQRFALHGPGAAPILTPMDSAAHGECLLVPRHRFDRALRTAAADAGANLLHGASASSLAIDDGALVRITHQTNSFDVRCRLLVGADGVGSRVARSAGLTGPSAPGRKFGFSFDLPGPAPSDDDALLGSIDMFIMPGGYLGVVRQHDETLHVAALVSAHGRSDPRDPTHFVREAAAIHPRLRELGFHRLQHSDLLNFTAAGPMPWRPHRVATGSIALVGDAAGYVEPFTGEGMTWALHSATALAETVARCGGAWSAHAAEEYAAAWRQRVQRRQRMCAIVASALDRPLVSRWMLRIGRAAPMLARRIARRVVAS
jgi:menaquinone-9 beta-reductase